MKVAVCVATCRRPDGLARLLGALASLRLPAPAPAVEVVVVDNDAAGSAEPVCAAAAPGLPWPLRYAREERRGVSHARNRAVAEARGADFIAFIDDDEVPEPAWLAALLRVQAECGADVVSGPVLPRFEEGVPAWVRRGGFFDAARRPTGTRVEHPGAGNVLIRAAALDGHPGPFDPRYALTGGEDTHLFLRMARAGCVMVWADDAVAHEHTPPERARAGWILRRVYRTANTWSACERELHPSGRAVAMRAAKGAARVAFGVATLPFAWLLGRHMLVRSLWYVCFGAGNLTGLTRLRYHEYRAVHGR